MTTNIEKEQSTMTTIRVWTSAKNAVLNHCQHGWAALHVDLSEWDQEDVETLAKFVIEDAGICVGYRSHERVAGYDVPVSTVEGLRTWVQGKKLELAEKLKKDVEDTSKRLEELRTCPVEELDSRANEDFQFIPEALDELGIEHDGRGIIGLDRLGRLEEYWAFLKECELKTEAKREAKRKREEQEDKERLAILAREEAKKKAWIQTHGSSRLKRGTAAGYYMEDLYTKERFEFDRPGWSSYLEDAVKLTCELGNVRDLDEPTTAQLDLIETLPSNVRLCQFSKHSDDGTLLGWDNVLVSQYDGHDIYLKPTHPYLEAYLLPLRREESASPIQDTSKVLAFQDLAE